MPSRSWSTALSAFRNAPPRSSPRCVSSRRRIQPRSARPWRTARSAWPALLPPVKPYLRRPDHNLARDSSMNETAVAAGVPHGLDGVMIAMDVVDILRHRDDLVRRELGEDQRETELISRLRKIYQDQGIEVSDSVLADGVKALKESRFVYTPPPSGWKRFLLTLWVQRATWGRRGAALLAVFVVGWAGYHMLVTRPATLESEKAR